MDLFATDTHFILVDGEESLWIDRLNTTKYESRTGKDALQGTKTEYLGTVYGFVGTLCISLTSDTRVVFIRQQTLIGEFKGHPIYRVCSVVAIPAEGDVEILLEPSLKELSTGSGFAPPSPGNLSTEVVVGGRPLVRVNVPAVRGLVAKKVDSKVDRRMLEEFHKMFTEAESFYCSPTYDITNSLQRQKCFKRDKEDEQRDFVLWELADQRFFWNSYMLKDLINAEDKKLHRWIQPIIQGFVQREECIIEHAMGAAGHTDLPPIVVPIEIWLMSRRNRFRAGTRYLRRGVDEEGNVANYVETEQIVVYKGHLFSFVQVRGSVPVFWSQSGSYKYRPPPRLERDEAETYTAFVRHISQELDIFGKLIIISLVERSGKEKVLADAYVQNVLQHNCNKVGFVSFDFHNHCRGMRFENISLLTDRLQDHLRRMGYCWIDSYGTVLQQEGTFKVNCVDCLDRTNVVQMHLAKEMLTFELCKVGLIAPEIGLPVNVKRTLQLLWANNGDTISKQYAGTNALKGDFTRTGERKLTGLVKDGMNSANRYYLNRFRDVNRQAAIDLMLGVRKSVTEADLTDDKPGFEKENGIESIKAFIEDMKKTIVPPDEPVLGAWGLVNGRTNDLDVAEVDTVLVLTASSYYVSDYDCSSDSMNSAQVVPLTSITGMELGLNIMTQTTTVWNIFSGNNANQTLIPHLRIVYAHEGQHQIHEFRSSATRFFNNVAVPVQQPEETIEALNMIAEAIKVASSAAGNDINITVTQMLQKNTGRRFPAAAATFVNKYLGSAVPMDSKIAKKITAPFRRGSGVEGRTANVELNVEEYATEADETLTVISEQRTPNLQLNVPSVCSPDLIEFAALTPEPLRSLAFSPVVNDLVLPSCGILSPGHRGIGAVCTVDSSLLKSLLTPGSDTANHFPSSPSACQETTEPVDHCLQRHRYSLPGNSLGQPSALAGSTNRSKTPEITVTEDSGTNASKNQQPNHQVPGTAPISTTWRRLSRSSEEVSRVDAGSSFGFPVLKGINQKITSGFQLPSILASPKASEPLPMKPSDIDNGRLPQQGQRRDLVFAPLGKLAKGVQSLGASYLDPRKLRESLKPVVKEESPEDQELEEKKSRSQTEFIDV